MLESLDTAETSPKYCKIIGEKEWWDSLRWHDSEWSRLTQPAFEELRTDEDFMDHLVRDIYSPMDYDLDFPEIGHDELVELDFEEIQDYEQEKISEGSISKSLHLDLRTSSPSAASASTPSRYENQKRRDWITFGLYLQNHRPPLSLPLCSGAHVLEFLRYLDQFGKTKVHTLICPFYGLPNPPAPCPCPLRQAWGSLDALVGRLRAAYEENGGNPETNPFGARAVTLYLREVRDLQSKARGISYLKKKKQKTLLPQQQQPPSNKQRTLLPQQQQQ